MEHIGGEDAYGQLKGSAGTRCLIILEGPDEIALEHQKSDEFLVRVIKECTLLEQATILITSWPHACTKVNAGRKIEIVVFGKKEIEEFVNKSFTDAHAIDEFLQ